MFTRDERTREMYYEVGGYLFKIDVGDIVELAALIVLLVTGYLSYRAIRESRRANTLAFLPIITLQLRYEGVGGDIDRLYVINNGNSPAYDIAIEDRYSLVGSSKLFKRAPSLDTLKFGKVGMIEPGGVRGVDISNSIVRTTGSSKELLIRNLTKSLHESKLRVTYRDASGVSYLCILSIFNNEFNIIKPPRILSFFRRIQHKLYLLIAYYERDVLYFRENTKYFLYKKHWANLLRSFKGDRKKQ